MIQILLAVAPYVSAISKLVTLASKFEAKTVTEEDVEKEIAKIKAWVATSEASDRALFAAAKAAKGGV